MANHRVVWHTSYSPSARRSFSGPERELVPRVSLASGLEPRFYVRGECVAGVCATMIGRFADALAPGELADTATSGHRVHRFPKCGSSRETWSCTWTCPTSPILTSISSLESVLPISRTARAFRLEREARSRARSSGYVTLARPPMRHHDLEISIRSCGTWSINVMPWRRRLRVDHHHNPSRSLQRSDRDSSTHRCITRAAHRDGAPHVYSGRAQDPPARDRPARRRRWHLPRAVTGGGRRRARQAARHADAP